MKGLLDSTLRDIGPAMIYASTCFSRYVLLAPTIKDLETQIKGLCSTNPRELRGKKKKKQTHYEAWNKRKKTQPGIFDAEEIMSF